MLENLQACSPKFVELAICMNLFQINFKESHKWPNFIKKWKKYYTPKCNENVRSDSLI